MLTLEAPKFVSLAEVREGAYSRENSVLAY